MIDAVNYKTFVVGFSCAIYALEQYLNYRQHCRYLMSHPPQALQVIIADPDLGKVFKKSDFDFKNSQRYELDKSKLGFFRDLYNQVIFILYLHYDVLPLAWNFSNRVMVAVFRCTEENEVVQSIVFVALYLVLQAIESLPFSLYQTFVVEQHHGFNKQTPLIFFTDLIKSSLVIGVIYPPVLTALLWTMKSAGDYFFVFAWGVIALLQLVIITIYPTVIQPLFNTLSPLEDGSLKESIENLASQVEFPLKKLFEIDGSKRSHHSNAYFYGFGKNKHIVIFDTLIDRTDESNDDNICAVLAHELGHWKMGHTVKLLVFNQVYILALFWLFSFFIHNRSLYADFGFDTMPSLIGLVLFTFIFSPISNVIAFLMHMYQRKNEYEADAFALKLGYASNLRSALIKLSVQNLSGLNVDPWHSMWNRSHPSLVERLNALEPATETRKDK